MLHVYLPLICVHLSPRDLHSLSLASRDCRQAVALAPELYLSFSQSQSLIAFLKFFKHVVHLTVRSIGEWDFLCRCLSHSHSHSSLTSPQEEHVQAWHLSPSLTALTLCDITDLRIRVEAEEEVQDQQVQEMHLRLVQQLPSLRRLELVNVQGPLHGALPALFAGQSTLVDLSLISCHALTNELLISILPCFPQLRSLTVSKCCSFAGMLSIPAELPLNRTLRKLQLSSNPHIFSRTYILNFPHMRGLDNAEETTTTTMSVLPNYFANSLKTQLFAPQSFPPLSVQFIDVSFTSINNRDLLQLIAHGRNIQWLIANVCHQLKGSLSINTSSNINLNGSSRSIYSPSVLRSLSLKGCISLTSLDLTSPSLSSVDLTLCRNISALSLETPQLNEINLSMLKQLDVLSFNNCRNLKALRVVGCEKLLSTRLGVKDNTIVDVNELISVLSTWTTACPQLNWTALIDENLGGSSLFPHRDTLIKWLQTQEFNQLWQSIDMHNSTSSHESLHTTRGLKQFS